MKSDGPIETISFPSITFSLIKLRSWIVSLVYRQNEDGINIFVVPCNSYRISTDQLHLYICIWSLEIKNVFKNGIQLILFYFYSE
jgi:hypothetical protein